MPDFLKITKKKLALALIFPIVVVVVHLLAFTLDAVLGMGGSALVNSAYLLANYLFTFVFLPLNILAYLGLSSIAAAVGLMLTTLWWYVLSCVICGLEK